MPPSVRTSKSHPIGVDWLPMERLGRVGLTFAPGKHSHSKWGGHRWERDLELDLDRLANRHGVRVLVCLLEDHEFELYGIPGFFKAVRTHGLELLRLPIPDGGVLPEFEPVRDLVDNISIRVDAGQPVVIHCAGGLGRTGTVAGCWLVAQGLGAAEAIELLHRVRSPNCPETRQQERFIHRFEELIAVDSDRSVGVAE